MREVPKPGWQRQELFRAQFLQAAPQDFYSETKLKWVAISSQRETKESCFAKKNYGEVSRPWSRLNCPPLPLPPEAKRVLTV